MPEIRVRRPPAAPNFGVCKGCGARMAWYTTDAGKAMCINEGAVPLRAEDGLLVFDMKDTHWATCPQAKSFKKKKTEAPHES